MTHWSNIKEKSFGYWPMQFLVKIYHLFGKPLLKLFLYPIVFFFLLFSKSTYVFSQQYLRRALKTEHITYRHVFRHIFSFADSLADRMIAWSGHIPMATLNIKTKEIHTAFIDELLDKKGAFLIISHLGNIEVFRALGNLHEFNISINAIMQINHTAHFNKLLKTLNPKSTTNIISATDVSVDTIIMLKDKINNGELVLTSGDRTASNNQDKTLPVNFLEQEAQFPIGCFTLASLLDSPVYFIFLLKDKSETYNLYMQKSQVDFSGSRRDRQEKIKLITHEYAKSLEDLTYKYPYQWYNFFDFWKQK